MTSGENIPPTDEDIFRQPPMANQEHPSVDLLVAEALFPETSPNDSHEDLPAGDISAPEKYPWQFWTRLCNGLLRPKTLDLKSAMSDAFHLLVNPLKMYSENYKYNYSGRLSYSREDPSFLILVTGLLFLSSLAWYLVFPVRTNIILHVLLMVVVNFYVTGVVISSVFWLVINKVFNPEFGVTTAFSTVSRLNINYVDWNFCFDIHCNSFLVIWFLLYVMQFFFFRLLTSNWRTGIFVGDMLYYGAFIRYFVVTYYGFKSLPLNTDSYYTNGPSATSKNPRLIFKFIIFAVIIPLLIVGYILSIILRFNIVHVISEGFFRKDTFGRMYY